MSLTTPLADTAGNTHFRGAVHAPEGVITERLASGQPVTRGVRYFDVTTQADSLVAATSYVDAKVGPGGHTHPTSEVVGLDTSLTVGVGSTTVVRLDGQGISNAAGSTLGDVHIVSDGTVGTPGHIYMEVEAGRRVYVAERNGGQRFMTQLELLTHGGGATTSLLYTDGNTLALGGATFHPTLFPWLDQRVVVHEDTTADLLKLRKVMSFTFNTDNVAAPHKTSYDTGHFHAGWYLLSYDVTIILPYGGNDFVVHPESVFPVAGVIVPRYYAANFGVFYATDVYKTGGTWWVDIDTFAGGSVSELIANRTVFVTMYLQKTTDL